MDGQTDGWTNRPSYRDAKTHLKMCCLQFTPNTENEKRRSIPKQLAFAMKFVLKHPRGNECFSCFSMILLVQSLFKHEVKRFSGLTRLILPSLLDLLQRSAQEVTYGAQERYFETPTRLNQGPNNTAKLSEHVTGGSKQF